MRSRRQSISQFLDDVLAWLTAFAGGVAEAAAAGTLLDVEDEIVTRTGRNAHGDIVQAKAVASFPSHNMVGARRVTAYAQSSDNVTGFVVQGEASAEHDDATDWLSYQRIVGLAKLIRAARKGGVGIRTGDDAVKRIARLRRGEYVPRRKCKVVGAESVCGVRFFRGNQATARPFCAPIRTSKDDCANNAVSIHDRAPLLITQSTILAFALFHRSGQCRFQLAVVGDLGAIRGILSKHFDRASNTTLEQLLDANGLSVHGDLLAIISCGINKRRCRGCPAH